MYSHERATPPELTAAEKKQLRASKSASRFFDAQPNWYRRAALHLIVSARKPETRRRRLEQLIELSAAGRTIPPLTRRKP